MAERVRIREIDDDEGRRLLQIVRRGTGSVVTWQRAQMVLQSAQGMAVAKITEVTFTSADRVRDVIHNFNTDGFASLYPKYKGGRPKTFTLSERREIKKMAKSKPAEHGLPFSTWSLVKLADFLVTEGVVDDISHEGLRILLREEGVTFQCVRRRATYTRPYGIRHLFAAYDLGKDQLYGHIKKTKTRSNFLEFCRCLRSLHPAQKRIAIVCDNYSPHLTTKRCRRVADWAEANNVEIAYTPTNSSWLNRTEAQFTALRYFTLDDTDHPSHKEQGSMIRRYIIWRNRHANDNHLRKIVARTNVA
ncbi:helix-turn-helix domain-containing protein [Streptomyces yangpuensis]|uniref:helix-turn-helix domain-containing protein n=1 Tax=Streptomyces yangpuensis TaxID=1648182 RepID=UPI00382232F7